ncbi:HIRAN domain-containing protein [Amycolatopsis balhimycina]|uniref:HIRAN domain-containing protein n=1 Tax=Amycolatopsis balhimycina TaxID=208443 RepID=UPI000F7858C6|nr:HIRAN domain-containing protein [Amycolatopsis balhimycina]
MAVEGFRTLPGLSDTMHRYTSERLFPIFAERVISSRRPDRQISMEALGLTVGAAPFEVLQRSGGRRVGDEIEVLPAPIADSDGALTVDFLVHGVRYQTLEAQARISQLELGELLRVVPETDNEWDSRALLVTDCDEVCLGYVPGPLLDLLHSAESCSVSVLRANGPEVGYHFRLLVRARLRVPAGYQPFSGPGWETVA